MGRPQKKCGKIASIATATADQPLDRAGRPLVPPLFEFFRAHRDEHRLSGHTEHRDDERAFGVREIVDIVEAIDGTQSTFGCTEIRQRGPMATPAEACLTPCAINRAMIAADGAWRAALREVTVADLARDVDKDYPADVMATISGWLAGEAV